MRARGFLVPICCASSEGAYYIALRGAVRNPVGFFFAVLCHCIECELPPFSCDLPALDP